jgi:hypothetical protein
MQHEDERIGSGLDAYTIVIRFYLVLIIGRLWLARLGSSAKILLLLVGE